MPFIMVSQNGLMGNVSYSLHIIQILIMMTLLVSTIYSLYYLFLEVLLFQILIVEMALLRMVNAVMMAMTSKRMDVTPVSAKEVLKTNKKGLIFRLKLSGGL